ncbi:hypothetical protein ACFY9N_02970 [Microbacterium sp. NPDC008134]|uniref:hypothetical protein n=1 Tax=Microbacterium sp. NPDC008134 TaxID=3364183 RepID=UPI0036EF6F7E
MRGVAVVVGGLLVIGGATVVVLADQQRAAEVAQLHERVEQATERLDDIGDENLSLAAQLTALRSQIAEQDAALTDTAGFMQ